MPVARPATNRPSPSSTSEPAATTTSEPGRGPSDEVLRSGGGALRLPVRHRGLGRAAAVEVAQLRLQVGPEARAVLALEGAQLLDLALEAGALALQGADGLGVPTLGVLLQRGS